MTDFYKVFDESLTEQNHNSLTDFYKVFDENLSEQNHFFLYDKQRHIYTNEQILQNATNTKNPPRAL